MNNLKITQRRNGAVVILDLNGNIRIGDGNVKLHEALRLLVNEGEKNILLNLEGVSYVDSTGLGEMIAGYVTLKKHQGELKLLNLTVRVRELMVITKLLTIFDSYKTESDAVKSFRPFLKNVDADPAVSVAVSGYSGL